jgi:hypothetical protein
VVAGGEGGAAPRAPGVHVVSVAAVERGEALSL